MQQQISTVCFLLSCFSFPNVLRSSIYNLPPTYLSTAHQVPHGHTQCLLILYNSPYSSTFEGTNLLVFKPSVTSLSPEAGIGCQAQCRERQTGRRCEAMLGLTLPTQGNKGNFSLSVSSAERLPIWLLENRRIGILET